MTVGTSYWDTDIGDALRAMAEKHARLPGYQVAMVIGVRPQGVDGEVYLIEADLSVAETRDPRLHALPFTLHPGTDLPPSAPVLTMQLALLHPRDLERVLRWADEDDFLRIVRDADVELLYPRRCQLDPMLAACYDRLVGLVRGTDDA